jgi:hypothetical protein
MRWTWNSIPPKYIGKWLENRSEYTCVYTVAFQGGVGGVNQPKPQSRRLVYTKVAAEGRLLEKALVYTPQIDRMGVF